MTRDEFVKALCLVYTREHGYLVAGDALFSSDTEQRRVIEQQAQQIATLKSELSHWPWVRFKQLEEENATLREVLKELYALVQGECPSLLNEDSGGDAELDSKIEQALKEVEP